MHARTAFSSLRPLASSSRQCARAATIATPSRLAVRSLATGAEPSASVSPSSSPAPPPPASASASTSSSSSAAAPVDPKLSAIVDQIEGLTLLQASELVSQLKTRLNIQDIALPAAGAAAAPAAAAPAADAAAEEEKPKAKTTFTLKLKGLKDPTAKAKVIKEVKAINTTMNLVEAKKFVESAPQTLKEGLNKEDAEKLQKAIEAAGGVVELD
ncbi:unnamed protein product [Parajaminaea phylloscopi]